MKKRIFKIVRECSCFCKKFHEKYYNYKDINEASAKNSTLKENRNEEEINRDLMYILKENHSAGNQGKSLRDNKIEKCEILSKDYLLKCYMCFKVLKSENDVRNKDSLIDKNIFNLSKDFTEWNFNDIYFFLRDFTISQESYHDEYFNDESGVMLDEIKKRDIIFIIL